MSFRKKIGKIAGKKTYFKINICVRTPDGNTLLLPLKTDRLIRDLKAKIRMKYSCVGTKDSQQFLLIFEGEILDDEDMIGDYQINFGTTIDLMLCSEGENPFVC
jgi:hypothetical protein